MLTSKRELRFLAIPGQEVRVVAKFEDAKVDLHLARIRRDRRGGSAVEMESIHLGEVERRQDVAIDDEDRLLGPLEVWRDRQRSPAGVTSRSVGRTAPRACDRRRRYASISSAQVAGDDRDVAKAKPG